jgi:hypothetical protein
MLFVARLADTSFFRLSPSLGFLYYLFRPLRLTCKWVWLLLLAEVRQFKRQSRSAERKS